MNTNEPGLLSAAWRFRYLVVVVTATMVALGLIYHLLRPPEDSFRAVATVIVQQPVVTAESGTQNLSVPQFIRSQLEILGSPLVMEAAAEVVQDLGLDISADAVASAVSIIGTPDSPLVSVAAVAEDEVRSVAIANAVAIGYQDVVQRQVTARADGQVARIDAQLEAIDARLVEIDAAIAEFFAENPAIEALRVQAEEAIAEIPATQLRLTSAVGEEAEQLRLRITDYRESIDIYRDVLEVSSSGAEQRALLSEQAQQVDRRSRLLVLRDEAAIDAGAGGGAASLVQEAVGAARIAGLNLPRTLAATGILGLAMGVALAYLLSSKRRTISSRSEPAAILGVPLLADVPAFEEERLASAVPMRDYPRSAAAEAFRFATMASTSMAGGRGVKSVMVVSATVGHGKTTTAVNMAVAAATQGKSVLIVDGDFGSQQASFLLAGESHGRFQGITDIVEGVATAADAVHRVELGNGVAVFLLPRGTRPGLPAPVLQSQATAELWAKLATQYDWIIVDGPPLMQVAYASNLAAMVDSLIVVVEHQSSESSLTELGSHLDLLAQPVLGYVYNRSPLRREMTMTEGSMADILGDSGLELTRD